jgi:hypothetical protein
MRPPDRLWGYWLVVAISVSLCLVSGGASAATVYKWHDEKGTLHLSMEKPPEGVPFELVEVASTPSSSAKRNSASSGGSTGQASTSAAPASAAQVAERSEILSGLKNRECVIALEALDRKTSAAEPTSAAEIRRLQETVEANCSKDPAGRRKQEEMAARLRVANGPACVDARNKLGTMLEPGSKIPREQLRVQQGFVDEYCTPPVR